jgi:hypothetical protein
MYLTGFNPPVPSKPESVWIAELGHERARVILQVSKKSGVHRLPFEYGSLQYAAVLFPIGEWKRFWVLDMVSRKPSLTFYEVRGTDLRRRRNTLHLVKGWRNGGPRPEFHGGLASYLAWLDLVPPPQIDKALKGSLGFIEFSQHGDLSNDIAIDTRLWLNRGEYVSDDSNEDFSLSSSPTTPDPFLDYLRRSGLPSHAEGDLIYKGYGSLSKYP